MAAASGPSGPPVNCGASGLFGFVKYNSNHGPLTPYPAGSSIFISVSAAVAVAFFGAGVESFDVDARTPGPHALTRIKSTKNIANFFFINNSRKDYNPDA